MGPSQGRKRKRAAPLPGNQQARLGQDLENVNDNDEYEDEANSNSDELDPNSVVSSSDAKAWLARISNGTVGTNVI